MNEVSIPVLPSLGDWSEPTDPDLKWISLACWCYCQLYNAHEQAGYKARVVTQTDVDDMLNDANSGISDMLSAIDSAYEGGNGEN